MVLRGPPSRSRQVPGWQLVGVYFNTRDIFASKSPWCLSRRGGTRRVPLGCHALYPPPSRLHEMETPNFYDAQKASALGPAALSRQAGSFDIAEKERVPSFDWQCGNSEAMASDVADIIW